MDELVRHNAIGTPLAPTRQDESRFGFPSRRLATYGTLAPGRPNHHVVAHLAGQWRQGWVEGQLHPQGWGATYGFPALVWESGGPRVEVAVLESIDLEAHWPAIDAFEGDAYRRIWIPVFGLGEDPVVGCLYALAEAV